MRRLWDAILVLFGRRVALPVDFPARRERLKARCRLLTQRLHEARQERDEAVQICNVGTFDADFARKLAFQIREIGDRGELQ